jgi:hypothetical protein
VPGFRRLHEDDRATKARTDLDHFGIVPAIPEFEGAAIRGLPFFVQVRDENEPVSQAGNRMSIEVQMNRKVSAVRNFVHAPCEQFRIWKQSVDSRHPLEKLYKRARVDRTEIELRRGSELRTLA